MTTPASTAQALELLADNGIDRNWLGQAIAGADSDAKVESLTAGVVGTGQVGENVRCKLTWSPNQDGDLPTSVVIKLASSNETSRAAAAVTRTYVREVGFYRDLADSVAIRVPRVHHVSEDQEANRFILVMEDITPAAAGDQLAGCSMEQAELAMTAAADLHGSTWDRDDLADLPWLDSYNRQAIEDRVGLVAALYPGFVERYQDRLSADALEFGAWLAERYRDWSLSRLDLPQCLTHGDFRLDNMLFGTAEPAPPLTTVDWQTPSLGPALSDVAYFLSGSLERSKLRAAETTLLTQYRNRLGSHGVNLSEDDCLTQYRLASPGGFIMAVIASQLVGQTDRGDEMFLVMAEGSASQSLDLDTQALV